MIENNHQGQQERSSSQDWRSPQQSWFAQAVQTVQRWSAKVPAVSWDIDQTPLARPQTETQPLPLKPKRWKRSRTLRLTMQMRQRRMRSQGDSFPMKNLSSAALMICYLLLTILTFSGSIGAYGYYQDQHTRLQGLANQQVDQTTRIYDRYGQLLYELYDSNQGRRTAVNYKYIPKVMQDAMVAAEDHTFWTNSGVDPQGILRAAGGFMQANSVQGGGSTLTQQLIKNLTGDKEMSITRKIPEATLAIGLTQQYPKWKILEMYFNVAPFGSQDLGVESAVEEYFHLQPQCDTHFHCIPAINYLNMDAHGKHNPLLGLARASFLAGLPQNPVSYDPTIDAQSRQLALERQKVILAEMMGMGMQVDGLGTVTPDIAQQVEALTARMTFTRYEHLYHGCEHFVNWVITLLESQIGVHAFLTGGFNIRTTIDANLEQYVERAVHRHLDQPEYQAMTGGNGPLNIVNNVNDAAVVVMNAKTGEVMAMNGSANWDSANPRIGGEYNAAIAPRQPGSSFKPIVYATAFQMGWYPGITLTDQKTYFPTGGPQTDPEHNAYHPTDYGNTYHNTNSTIREAIANSFNVPAVKALEYAGMNNVATMARRLGITTLSNHLDGPSMALGTVGVPLVQMVGAYQVFANQGRRIPPQGVLDMWDNYGHNLYHFDPSHPHSAQVISPQIAYLMTSVLSDEQARALEFDNVHTLSLWDWQQADGQEHQVAAKTGTTDDFKDNWTIGYTPDVVVGVWAGNADNSSFRGNVIGLTGAAPIWHSVIEHASGRCAANEDNIPCGDFHSTFTQHTFPVPPGVVRQSSSSATGLAGTGNVDYMLDGDVPQQSGR